MGSKGTTSQTQQNQNIQYTPYAQQQLGQIYNQAAAAASTPYTAYGQQPGSTYGINGQTAPSGTYGQLVSPLVQAQQRGMAGIAQGQGQANPYLYGGAGLINQGAGTVNQGAGLVAQNAQPITAGQIQQYENPYQSDVINATMANIANTNAQQQQQVQGNAALQGALGGDRSAVAQSVLAGQQALASNQTLAGLQAQNYQQATQTAIAQQQAGLSGGQALGSLGATIGGLGTAYGGIGTSLEGTTIAGGQAQMGAGAVEQQTKQAADTAMYQQYLQSLAYPYQQASFLGQTGIPAAGAMGGYQSQIGQTNQVVTPPYLSLPQAAVGAGAIAYGAFGSPTTGTVATGGRINPYAVGGRAGFADGGTPYPWQASADNIATSGSPGTAISVPNTMPQVGQPGTTINNASPTTNTLGALGSVGGLVQAGQGLSKAYNWASNGLSNLWNQGQAANPANWSQASDLGTGSWSGAPAASAPSVGAPMDLSGAGAAAAPTFDSVAASGTGLAGAEAASPVIGATDATADAMAVLDGADAATDAGLAILPELAAVFAKRGGRMGYDDGGATPQAYPVTSQAPYPYGKASFIPQNTRVPNTEVNYGKAVPAAGHPLAMPNLPGTNPYQSAYSNSAMGSLVQAGQVIHSMQNNNAAGGRIGYAAGGLSPDFVEGTDLAAQDAAAVPIGSEVDLPQGIQQLQTQLAPVQQTMKPSFAATGGKINGYDDGGPTPYEVLSDPEDMINAYQPTYGQYTPLEGNGAVTVTASTPKQSPSPSQSQSSGPSFDSVAGSGSAPSFDSVAQKPSSQPQGFLPAPRANPYQPPQQGGAAASGSMPTWEQVLNPKTFSGSTPQRQQVASQMMKQPDFWTRAGINILAADPSHGWGHAIGSGLAGTVGEYDQWSKDDLTAEQKAQELATNIKKHVDQYTKMTPFQQAAIKVKEEGVGARYAAIGSGMKWEAQVNNRMKMIQGTPAGAGLSADQIHALAIQQLQSEHGGSHATAPAGGETLPEAARSKLQEGKPTTFNNGQTWILKDGTPTRVQ